MCKNGHFFESGTGFDPGDTGVTVTLTVGSAPRICPECGASARVLGGSYHIAKDTIELLQGPERTVSELERLRDILREGRESGANPEEVRRAVQREFPGWGQALTQLLVPKTPGEFYGLLSLIVAIIGVLLAYERSEQARDAEPDQIINNITVVQEAAPVPGQPQVTPSAAGPTNPAHGERIGRNEPCPCGSGQKFKKCHGKNGEKRYQGP
jgi:hypothetical protein